MLFDLYPNGHPLNLQLGVRVLRPVKLRVTVFDPGTARVYADHKLLLKQSRSVRVKLPIVPDELTVNVESNDLSQGQQVFVLEQIKVEPDTRCPLDLTEGDRQFIRFAKWFAVGLSQLEAGEKGTLYQSDGYSMLLLDTIKDGNIELTTPARIARASGVIEVSKKATADFTVPMLIVMLLHEYSHKYKNPEFGKEVENEITADIIAIHIALNLGFDLWEVENCFRAVFAKKDTELNRRRMGAVSDFIALFKKNEPQRCKTAPR